MKITLRKASALQNAINDTIKSIRLESEVRINEFQQTEVTLNEARAEMLQNVQRKVELTNALYSVRDQVKAANSQSVDALLTKVANVEKNIQIYTELVGYAVRENVVVLNGKLDKIRNRPADVRNPYGFSDEVTSGIVTEDDVANFRKVLAESKKTKQKLQDQILEANVRTEITLDEHVVITLTAENLL